MRSELRARRRQLSAAERIAAASGVAGSLLQLPEFVTDVQVAGYWAIDGELPLHSVVASLRSRGQHYLLPRVIGPRALRFAQWRPGVALESNRYGIPEPACVDDELLDANQLDVVLLPLLGFDREGHRIGYGGGYYDATFAFLRERTQTAQPVLVGIGYDAQRVEAIVPTPWDVPLDYVATETELIDCWHQRSKADSTTS
ncbi:MAG: 5-formyltetrahydrofolate cyclo-ligase [Dokdonella sp.]